MKRAPSFERPRAAEWYDRLYRPPCWRPEEEPTGDLRAWAQRQVPNVNRSFEQALRFWHHDLQALSDADLRRERILASLALAWLLADDPGHSWTIERLQRIAGELARRRRSGDGRR